MPDILMAAPPGGERTDFAELLLGATMDAIRRARDAATDRKTRDHATVALLSLMLTPLFRETLGRRHRCMPLDRVLDLARTQKLQVGPNAAAIVADIASVEALLPAWNRAVVLEPALDSVLRVLIETPLLRPR